MKTKAPIKVPVSLRNGGILHSTDYARGADSRDEAEAINAQMDDEHGHHRWGAEYVFEEVKPFTTSLRLVDTYHSKSSAYVTFEAPMGEQYPVFMTDLSEILSHANMVDGWLEPATYEVTKRGVRSYGIRKVKEYNPVIGSLLG